MIGLIEASPLAILQENCVRCHSPSKRKGGLLIDSKESLIKGGDSGPAIELGDARNSYLIETLFPDADSHMPPKGQLKPREIETLEKWINDGAKWNIEEWARLTRPEKKEMNLSRTFPENYTPVLGLALSPDGKRLAAGRRNQVDIYEVNLTAEGNAKPGQLTFQQTLPSTHLDQVQSAEFSPDGHWLVTGGFRKLIVHDLKDPSKTRTLTEPFLGRQTALAFSPDGKKLLVADSMPAQLASIHQIAFPALKVETTIESAHDDTIFDIAVSADGQQMATASADRLAIVRNTGDHEITTTLEGHTSYVLGVAFGPAGQRVATSGDDEAIKVWDAKTGTQISTFSTRKSGPVGGLTWIDDPDRLKKKSEEKDQKKAAEINTDRIVAINDLGQPGTFTDLNEHEGAQRSTGAKERRHDGVSVALTSMAYDPERLILFAGSEDGRIFVWDSNGKKIDEKGAKNIEVTKVSE